MPDRIPEEEEETTYAAGELQAFAGLHQALGRLVLRDGRPRKEIAEAADINASMLSGYLTGRRLPSLEHLDRLLTALGVGIEELTYELRAVDYRVQNAPLVVWPKLLQTPEGESAAALLTSLLEEVRELLRARVLAEPRPVPSHPRPALRKGRRRGRAPRPAGDEERPAENGS